MRRDNGYLAFPENAKIVIYAKDVAGDKDIWEGEVREGEVREGEVREGETSEAGREEGLGGEREEVSKEVSEWLSLLCRYMAGIVERGGERERLYTFGKVYSKVI